jgi:predicted TIM-barrel fold metal-dependent hydrolase
MIARPLSQVDRAGFAAIDVHNHLGRWLSSDGSWMVPDVRGLLEVMDVCGIERIVNLDGRWGEELDANLARYDRAHPGRFATFCHVDWGAVASGAGPDHFVTQLEDNHRRGARGLKIWKDIGLTVRDQRGVLVRPDDERVVATVRRAGELGMPVLIHTADPVAFFEPVDARNERLEELVAMPHWWFGDPATYPTFADLMDALDALVGAAPDTTVIGAHVGCHAEDLHWVGRMLDRHPNFCVDIAGRLAELGRQPRAFQRLVSTHPDRVLFGSDFFPPTRQGYRLLFRFLETTDEHWPYAGSEDQVPSQGRWAVSGAGLDPAALESLYRGNALRLGL